MADRGDLTVEKIDRALLLAREQNASETDVALLWVARAGLLGLTWRPEYLRFVMGVSDERAEELTAILAEHGFIDRDTSSGCPVYAELLDDLGHAACPLCGQPATDHDREGEDRDR